MQHGDGSANVPHEEKIDFLRRIQPLVEHFGMT